MFNLITCYDLTYDFEIESVDFILGCFLLPFLRVVCFKQVMSLYHFHVTKFRGAVELQQFQFLEENRGNFFGIFIFHTETFYIERMAIVSLPV